MIIKFMKEIGIRSQNWSPQTFQKNINEALGYDLTDKHTTVVYGGVGIKRHASRPRWKIR
jgi:hypothetical protein